MAEYTPTTWTNGVTPLDKINMDHLETQYDLIKSEDLTFAGVKSFSGTLLVALDIQHIGDTDTLIAFTADAISLATGGASRIDLSDTGFRIGGAGARVTGILDEDAMGSNSAVKLATQQSIKAYVDSLPSLSGTVADWQANAATGDATNPERLNDNNTGTDAVFDGINEYCQVLFEKLLYISEYRQYGSVGNNQDGVYKVQHLVEGVWKDNTVGIATRGAASWGAWTPLTTPVLTGGIRLVCTTVDTGGAESDNPEWEMRG